MKQMRIVFGLMISMILILCFGGCGDDYSYTADTDAVKSEGYIVVPKELENVTLYAEPYFLSEPLTRMSNQDKVEIFDIRGKWFEVAYGGYRGFVPSEYISLTNPEDMRNQETTVETTTETTTTTTTTTETTEMTTDVSGDPSSTETKTTRTTTSPEERPDPSLNRNSLYIYNSALNSTENMRFTLHVDGNYDYVAVACQMHSPEPGYTENFNLEVTNTETHLGGGSVLTYDYIFCTLVPYYDDGTHGEAYRLTYEITYSVE
ncbi:MAG: SH3 domain-containing protein [Oscillospiraceae bacterium]|nr:SH3 domain-containing protein [Oscillospiraceae bacterium]